MLLVATSLLFAPADGEPDDGWTRFRGPGGGGIASATELPVELDLADAVWRVELPGGGHSSPVVLGERIYLTTSAEERGERALHCLSTRDGRVLWSHTEPVNDYRGHELNDPASSTPAADGDGVYVSWVDGGELEALAFDHDGEPRWRTALGPWEARHGGGSSPVLAGDVLVVASDNESGASALYGLDTESGEVRWRRERTSSRAAFSTPALTPGPDGTTRVLFASTSHGITCLDAASGELLWEESGLFERRCVASPVVAGPVVFATAGRGGGGEESAAVLLADPPEGASRIAYRVRRNLPYVPTGVARGGLLFLVSDGGIASCLRADSGEELWRERLGGEFFASPICVDDRVYAVSKAGELVVFAASERFAVLARVPLGEPSFATPAVAGGVLYLRTERHLIAIGG